MSYVRWGHDSEVYVFFHAGGWFQCEECKLIPTPKKDSPESAYHFRTMTGRAMAEHLEAHLSAGHKVPAYAIQALRLDR